MMPVVIGFAENVQVFQPVVGAIAVLMVDVFVWAKCAPKMTLHHNAMLVLVSVRRDPNPDISARLKVSAAAAPVWVLVATSIAHAAIIALGSLRARRD